MSSAALTPTPRPRLGTKVKKQPSFHQSFCSPGFLFVSCSLGKPHSTSFRLPRSSFSSATKVNWKIPSSHICDPIKLQERAVLRIHLKKPCLPDVPGPTASYTDHQKSASYTRRRPAVPDIELHEALRVGTDFVPSRIFLKIMRGDRAQAG